MGYDVSAWLYRGVLIDTGFHRARRRLLQALDAFSPVGALVTHWHEDHAGNAALLAARMPVWMPTETERTLRERPPVKLYRRVIWGRAPALQHPVLPAHAAPLVMLHTPGHSPDHHVAFDSDTGTLFSADLWLGVRVRALGSEENPYQIVESLERVIDLRPERMFDAHRGPVENPVEALRAKRDWLRETVHAVESRLRAGDPEGAIVREVLGGEELTAFVTEGEYARRNLVRAIQRFG